MLKNILLTCVASIFILLLSSCNTTQKEPTRESIFDHIVYIPKELVDVPYLPPYCDEIADLKKGFIDIKNGKLYYEEEGHGIPLVLIAGGPGNTHHVFHPYFSRIKDIARIIYYDQRGTGKSSSDKTGKTYTMKQAVEDLESLRKALKINRWAVLGFSYGGLLAQCYALTHPDDVTGLVLVTAGMGLPDTNLNPERVWHYISKEERNTLETIKKKSVQGILTAAQGTYNALMAGAWKSLYYYKPTREELIRKALYAWDPAPGFEALMRSEIDTINLKGKFDNFTISTLIMEGRYDVLWWNTDRIELMRKNHPHAQVEIFEKSGHTMFADEPQKFFSVLRNFLEKSNKI